jgi:diaminopimelate epimerase
MSVITFTKYEGLGNDFVVVDAEAPLGVATVSRLCDRHFGVGADGVLVVAAPTSAGASATMIVQNADGSRPEMCGNGLRCVAVHVARARGMNAGSLTIDTDAGPRGCELDGDDVRVDMGIAREEGDVEVNVDGYTLSLARVSMGNPHAITFEALGENALARFGPRVATHPAFPEGTNVELARKRDDGSIEVAVWERGVGPTLACGTGACATAVRACRLGLATFGAETLVHLPGGALVIEVATDLRVMMKGPARRVFSGEVPAW